MARLFSPKYRRGVAYLYSLLRIFSEQMIERSGIGKGGFFAHRCVRALRLAPRIKGVEIERNDVRARSLGTPHTPDRWMQALNHILSSRDQAVDRITCLHWPV